MLQRNRSDIVRQASTSSIVWGILLIILGIVVVGFPVHTAVAVSVLIAWIIVLVGVVQLIIAFQAHRAGSLVWKLLLGLAYICFGVYLIAHPMLGVVSLALLLATLLLIAGSLDIVLFFQMRSMQGSIWVLIDGIVTLLLGLLIFRHWPSGSAWAIGTLVGISMIVDGFTRVMLSMAVRRATTAGPSSLAA
jgi:uncharacterized membrane protein HdeD (DUF308 family)